MTTITIRRVTLNVLFAVVMIGAMLAAPLTPVERAAAQPRGNDYRLVGYFSGYSIYEDYFVTDIRAEHLTHLIYGTIAVSENGQCELSDPWTDTGFRYPGDEENQRLRGNILQLQRLRGDFPELKVLMSVGGWDYSTYFTDVARTDASRARFVRSCITLMQQYLFDGIDIDWRYPVNGGATAGRPDDRENFNLLLAEFRKQLDALSMRDEDKTYLLSVLVPAVKPLYQNMDLARLASYVDWMNVMSFGYQGEWSEIASHHAPLYPNARDPRGEVLRDQYNVDGTVEAFLDMGVPAEKMVLGIPFFGQAWRNVKANDYFGLYQSASGVPLGTRPGGILYYSDLLPLLHNNNYIDFFDEEARVPWLYSPKERIAISYENQKSVREKAQYVRQRRLGGIMIWQLGYDYKEDSLLIVADQALNPADPS